MKKRGPTLSALGLHCSDWRDRSDEIDNRPDWNRDSLSDLLQGR